MKMSDRIGVGIGCAGLVAAAQLVLRVGGSLGRLTRSRQRAVASGLLGGNLGCEQTIVDRVLEAAQPALLVLGGIFCGWRVSHLLTLHWLPQ
jgi:hypothetical protein